MPNYSSLVCAALKLAITIILAGLIFFAVRRKPPRAIHRRVSSGDQVNAVARLTMRGGKSADFTELLATARRGVRHTPTNLEVLR